MYASMTLLVLLPLAGVPSKLDLVESAALERASNGLAPPSDDADAGEGAPPRVRAGVPVGVDALERGEARDMLRMSSGEPFAALAGRVCAQMGPGIS